MDENLHKDNLEDFFKKSFDQLDQEAPDGDWDKPSNQVWEGIESDLLAAGKKTALKISWLQMSAAAAVLLLLGVFYLLVENQDLSSQLDEQTQALELLQNEVDRNENLTDTNQPTEELTDAETPNATDGKQPNENKTLNSNQLNQSSDYASLIAGKAKKEVDHPSKTEQQQTEIIKEENNNLAKEDAQKEEDLKEGKEAIKRNEVATLDLTPSPMIEQQWPTYLQAESVMESPLSDNHNFIKPVKNRKLGFYIGGYISPNRTYRQIERNLPGPFPDPNLNEFTSPQVSLEMGIRLGVKLGSKLSIETGVSKYDVVHKGKYMFKFIFDPTTEMPGPNGIRESIYETCLPTAYSKSDLEVKINRSNMHPLQPGQAISVEVESKQKLQFTSIPLIANYQLKQSKVNIGLKGGLALNLLHSQELDLISRARMNGLGSKIKKQEDDYSIIKNKTIDYIVGVDLNYRLTPRVSLEIEPTYRKNITPIADTDVFSASTYALGVNAGVNYHF